jgi:hypothetical protein
VLKTPTKDAKMIEKREFDLFDDAPREESPDTVDSSTFETVEVEVDPQQTELEELRTLYVGDVNITEGCATVYHTCGASLIRGST